jgi:hypothetical protein
MAKTIQVRGVPEQLYCRLKARASPEGLSLAGYIKKELERAAERSTVREWLELTERARPIPAKRRAAQVVRGLRDSR